MAEDEYPLRESRILPEVLIDAFADFIFGADSARNTALRKQADKMQRLNDEGALQRERLAAAQALVGAANNILFFGARVGTVAQPNTAFGVFDVVNQAATVERKLRQLTNADLLEAFAAIGFPSPFLPGVLPATDKLPYELTDKLYKAEITRRIAEGLLGPRLEDYTAAQVQAAIARDDAAQAILSGLVQLVPSGNPNTPPVKLGPGATAGAFSDPIQYPLVVTIGEGIAVGGLQYATTPPAGGSAVKPPGGLRPPEAPGTAPGPNGPGNYPRPPGAFPDDIFRANPADP